MSETSWIPLDHNILLLILSSLLIIGVLVAAIRNSWKPKEIIVVLVPAALLSGILLGGAMGITPNLLLSNLGTEVPDEPIDYVIHVEAQLKPWTFNVTRIENATTEESIPINVSKYETIPEGVGYPETAAYYNIDLKVGTVYQIIIKALDTDHGFEIVPTFQDYFGNPVVLNLPQLKEISFYAKPTVDQIGNHLFSCNFYCGLGHGQMNGFVTVTTA
ncbi:MAG: hypothetical protein ACFFFG_08020 [Candidatus Thorarchaeota archaeon]